MIWYAKIEGKKEFQKKKCNKLNGTQNDLLFLVCGNTLLSCNLTCSHYEGLNWVIFIASLQSSNLLLWPPEPLRAGASRLSFNKIIEMFFRKHSFLCCRDVSEHMASPWLSSRFYSCSLNHPLEELIINIVKVQMGPCRIEEAE